MLALAGCGFQPVYAPGGGGALSASGSPAGGNPSLQRAMASVRVGPIGERYGQVMRRNLQRGLEGLEPGVQARYLLDVNIANTAEVLGYRTDGLITRIRVIATANWVLTTIGNPPEAVDRGSARTLDAVNLPDLQFFAADASLEDMNRRLVTELSDRVVQGVAVALRRRMAAAPAA